MAAGDLWVARHGETAWTIAGQHTGRTDLPLTGRGERIARDELAPKLAGVLCDLVLSSPLTRALQTARLAGFEPEIDERLREFDYGDYEGLTTPQIRERDPDWDMWRDGCPGGETPDDVGARVDRVIAEAMRADGDVALVAHGHVLRVLAARWLEQPAAFGARLRLDTSTVSVLGFERETRVVLRWNA